MFALLTGLLAGTTHVWVGPDHLAAVAPLAAQQRSRARTTGVRWGLGHSAGVMLIGLLTLLLRESLPLEAISFHSEQLVGLMLIGIGIWAIRKSLKLTIHVHEHEHDGDRHVHIHAHNPDRSHGSPRAHQHSHVPVGIGLLHGLAGSAHFFGILPMLAFPTRVDAALYLLGFAGGTVLSMAVFAAMMGWLSARCADRSTQVYRSLISLSGAASLIIGAAWLF